MTKGLGWDWPKVPLEQFIGRAISFAPFRDQDARRGLGGTTHKQKHFAVSIFNG
jgi:hypothetical protein